MVTHPLWRATPLRALFLAAVCSAIFYGFAGRGARGRRGVLTLQVGERAWQHNHEDEGAETER